MPVSSSTSISEAYFPNGVTTAFPFEFKAASASEVVAIDADGAIISTSLYNVTLDGDDGGTLTFLVAPTAEEIPELYVASEPALTQLSDFDNAGPSFNPAALTRAFDRAAIRDLRQQRDIDRSIKVPIGADGFTVPPLDNAEGMVLGVVDNKPIWVPNDATTAAGLLASVSVLAVAVASDKADVEQLKADTDNLKTLAQQAVTNAQTQATDAGNHKVAAQLAAAQAQIAAAASGAYPNAAEANVPRGAISGTITNAGSGGTNGTFALGFTGGNFSINPTGTFTVAGGVVTNVSITGPGLYIGASPTAPTPTFAASAGLTGAAVTLNVDFHVASGKGYWALALDGNSQTAYFNNAGVATISSPVISIPTLAALQAAAISASYAKPGGTSDRTAMMTVTASAGLLDASSNPNALINGSTSGNNYTAAIVFATVAVSGHWLKFDYLYGADKIVTELKWYQTGTNTHGTWQAYIGDRNGVETAVGATFVLGGFATQTITTLAANLLPGQYVKLLGVSGNTNTGGTQFGYEMELKLTGTALDGRVSLPPGGAPGQVPSWDEATNKPAWGFAPFYKSPGNLSAANVIAEYWFDEGYGTRVRNKRSLSQFHIDFDATHQSTFSTPAPKWTKQGLRFRECMARTPNLTNVRTIGRLIWRELDAPTTRYDLGVNVAGEPIYQMGSNFNPNSTIRQITPEGTITTHYADNGIASWRSNRGGWVVEFIQANAQFNGRIGLGGTPTGTTSSARARHCVYGAMKVWDGVLTDAECLAEAAALFRPIGVSRGAYAVVDDCPIIIKGVMALGQSMIVGDPVLSDLESWKKAALAYVQNVWFWAAAKGTAGPPVFNFARSKNAERLRVGGNNWPDDMPHAAEHFGFEVGWCLAAIDGFNTAADEEAMFKGGLNGTFLAGPAEGVGSNSMHPAFPKANGWFWFLLKEIDTFQQYMMHHYGIGIRWKEACFDQGQQECGSANPAAYSLARQQNMQDFWDTLKLYLGSPPNFHMTVSPIHPNAAPTSYSPTYIANINNGIAAFDAANADVSTIVVSDLVLTPASTTASRTVATIDGGTYPPISPLELADGLHYPVIDQQIHDRRFRAAAVAAGY